MKSIVINEGDLLAYKEGETEILHRVTAVDPVARTLTMKQLNTGGPSFFLPFPLVAAGIGAGAVGLYSNGVS